VEDGSEHYSISQAGIVALQDLLDWKLNHLRESTDNLDEPISNSNSNNSNANSRSCLNRTNSNSNNNTNNKRTRSDDLFEENLQRIDDDSLRRSPTKRQLSAVNKNKKQKVEEESPLDESEVNSLADIGEQSLSMGSLFGDIIPQSTHTASRYSKRRK
jgi:hypothetical protein